MVETRVSERRKSDRILLSIPVQIESPDITNPLMLETADFSEGGVYLPSEFPLAVATRVTLTFRLSGLETDIRSTGVVVRSNDRSSEAGEPPGMAVEFLEHGKLSWHLLRRLLEAREQASQS